MKKFGYILMAAFAAASLAACSEKALDEVNKDLDHAPDAEAKFVFADVCTATAFTVVGGDFNTYLGVAVEHWGGVHNQLYSADQRRGEWISSSCFNNNWVGIYNTIKNARVVIAKTEDDAPFAGDAGNKALNGAAKVLLAYNSAVLTDLFGDTPYSEAGDYFAHPTPKIDKQEDIYKEIKTLLDEAIDQLTGEKTLGIGGFDFIYGGNAPKWLQFAYGLRARLALHTILRASDKNAVYDQILSDIENSFASTDAQAQFAAYDGDANCNPLFSFWYSREAIAASGSLAEKYLERNDPRASMIYCYPWDCSFDPNDPEEEFEPVPNGEGEELQEAYTDDIYLYAISAPTFLLSYSELQFIKAEVLARKGSNEEARDAAAAGIAAAFEAVNTNVESALGFMDSWGYGVYGPDYSGPMLSEEDAAEYSNAVLGELSGEELLGEIMVQKYLAFHGANGGSVEAYNDIRRLMAEGKNYITLANPKNATKFPLRLGYGSSDTTTNPNVQSAFGDGTYVFSEKVWWAGGSR